MTVKLSSTKTTKIFRLYFLGFTQTAIAGKLKVNQATVSLYLAEFTAMADEVGLLAAAKEFEIMELVMELHSLGAELKKSGLTTEDAKKGLKMALLFQECGIEEDEYGDLIQTYKKMDNEGYLFAAVELSQLEDEHGTSFEGIVDEYKGTSKQLAQAQNKLQDTHGEISSSTKELENINKQKKLADQDLKTHMDKVGVDMHRLKMVEALALILKKAGIPDQELPDYIQRQQSFNKAGISANLFTAIITTVNVVTSQDHGNKLFSLLSEYGSLMEVCAELKAQAIAIKEQLVGLEQQAKLKTTIEMDINKLKAQKASLEPHVADLHSQYQSIVMLQNDIAILTPEKEALELRCGSLKMQVMELNNGIETKEKEIADLKELELKHDAVLKEIAELQAKFEHDQKRWEIYQGFLGLVQSSSKDELLKSAKTLPALVESLPEKPFTKDLDFYKNYLLEDLTREKLPVLFECRTCGVRFAMGKQEANTAYQCPNEESPLPSQHNVFVEKNSLVLLKEVLSPEAQKHTVAVQRLTIVAQPETTNGKE
ncbi:hypothetical protein ACFLYB_06000 [Chloroflexota bacterium]